MNWIIKIKAQLEIERDFMVMAPLETEQDSKVVKAQIKAERDHHLT